MAQDLIQLELFPRLNISKPRVQKTHTPIFQFITKNCLFYYGKTKENQLEIKREIEYEGIKYYISITRQRGVKNNKVIYDNFMNYQDEKVFLTIVKQCYDGQHKVYAKNPEENVILYTSLYSIQKDIDKGLSKRFIKSSLDKLVSSKITIEDEFKTGEWIKNTSIIEDLGFSKKENRVIIRFSKYISDEIRKELTDKNRTDIAMANYKTLIDFRLPLSSYIYKTLIFNWTTFSNEDPTRQHFNQYNVWKFLKMGGFEYKNKSQKQALKRMVLKSRDELKEKGILDRCKCFQKIDDDGKPTNPNSITFYPTTKTLRETYNQPKLANQETEELEDLD